MSESERWVAFLRAVNVGKRRTPMETVREELTGLGFEDVSTYLNSGNAIFTAAGCAEELERAIEERLEATFGFEVTTFIRSAAEVEAIAAYEPFGALPAGHTHMVMLLERAPTTAVKGAIEALSNATDRLVVQEREVHWRIAGKSLDTSLERRDWKVLGDQRNTTRNATMLRKLAARLWAGTEHVSLEEAARAVRADRDSR